MSFLSYAQADQGVEKDDDRSICALTIYFSLFGVNLYFVRYTLIGGLTWILPVSDHIKKGGNYETEKDRIYAD